MDDVLSVGSSISRPASGRMNSWGSPPGNPLKCLSRMKGNFQVRFLEGGGAERLRLHSVRWEKQYREKRAIGKLDHMWTTV